MCAFSSPSNSSSSKRYNSRKVSSLIKRCKMRKLNSVSSCLSIARRH
ncbi:Uncharacterised protein [Vibrio cholerae]|nr:Uncharacterised protein [Vibrio cholerae]